MDNRFYVYAYFREDGRPCYIGKGTGWRWLVHERCSPNKHLSNIIRTEKFSRLKIADGLTNDEAKDLEVLLIRLVGRKIDGGSLVNQTDGGDGCRGQTPEDIERRIAPLRGRVRSEEVRKKISAGRRGIRRSGEARAKDRAAKLGNTIWLGRKHSEETKIKMRAKRWTMSAEGRQKISMARKGKRYGPYRKRGMITNDKIFDLELCATEG